MDQASSLFDAFDMLDLVLAIFGALIFAMWRGAGKSPWAIISGAAVGGLIKPVLFGGLLAGGLMMAASQDSPQNSSAPQLSDEQQKKIIDFWTK